MITRQQVALLFAYDFKLVDKEGREYEIFGLDETDLYCRNSNEVWYIPFTILGSDVFILAHPYSRLTDEVNGVIPLIEIAKVGFVDEEWVVENDTTVSCMDSDFTYSNGSFKSSGYAWKPIHVLNQPALFDKLYSLHFLPHGIEESNVKYIND